MLPILDTSILTNLLQVTIIFESSILTIYTVNANNYLIETGSLNFSIYFSTEFWEINPFLHANYHNSVLAIGKVKILLPSILIKMYSISLNNK